MNSKYVKYLKDWIEEKLEKIGTITKKKKRRRSKRRTERTYKGSESVRYHSLYF